MASRQKREADIQKALLHAHSASQCGVISLKDIAHQFNVPRTTLWRRYHGLNQSRNLAHEHQQYLSHQQEQILVDWIKHLSNVGQPISSRTITKKVQRIANLSRRPSPKWLRGFLQRHTSVRLGKPSSLDPKRAQAFNEATVSRHFELLKEVMDRHHIPWENVYNMDEKGIQRGGGRKMELLRFLMPRGRRPHYKIRSPNLELITIIECVCANGESIAPGFVFAGKEFLPEWFSVDKDICICTSPNGWTDDYLCMQWFQQTFIRLAQARNTTGAPLLLIYDGHGSHTSTQMVKLALEHNVHLFCLPPHTTHKLQPLDVGVFGPLQRKWQAHCDEILTNTGQEPRREDIVKVYMAARNEAITPELVQSAWRHCGMAPLNQNIFTKDDFAPSATSSTTFHIPASFPRPSCHFRVNAKNPSSGNAIQSDDGTDDDVDNNDDHDDDYEGYGTDDELVDQDPATRVRLPATIALPSGCVTDYLDSLGPDAPNLNNPFPENLLSADDVALIPSLSGTDSALSSSLPASSLSTNNLHIPEPPMDDQPVSNSYAASTNRRRVTSQRSTSRHSRRSVKSKPIQPSQADSSSPSPSFTTTALSNSIISARAQRFMSLTKPQLALVTANLDIRIEELTAKNNDLVKGNEELHTRAINSETRYSLVIIENEGLQQRLHAKQSRTKKSRNLVTNSRCFTSGSGLAEWTSQEADRQAKDQVKESKRVAKAAKEAEQVLRRAQQSNTIFVGSLSSKNKSDLQDIASALGLKADGLKATLLENIRNHFKQNPEQYKTVQFRGLADCPQKRPASSQNDENQPPTNRPRLEACLTHPPAQGSLLGQAQCHQPHSLYLPAYEQATLAGPSHISLPFQSLQQHQILHNTRLMPSSLLSEPSSSSSNSLYLTNHSL